ncbi:MAG: urease accessory protein UreD [Gammaproteobacteria bacterium]|nr:urease accessory protein UreD [Gammaproteobacteria bacterium]
MRQEAIACDAKWACAVERSSAPLPEALSAEWPAELRARFQRDRHGVTQLVRVSHRGPLRVQRLFQTPQWAECYLLHPPGGLVTGDSLSIAMHCAERAQVLVTTPAAGKVYGARQTAGWQRTQVNCVLEEATGLAWLPQDTICFDRARGHQSIEVTVAPSAWHVGWEQITFGRRASDAPFQSGQLRQSLCIRRGDQTIYRDQMCLTPEVLSSPVGLAGHTVMALVWYVCPVGQTVTEALDLARDLGETAGVDSGATSVTPELGLVRVLGDDAAQVRRYLESIWAAWTPLCVGQTVQPPRIWRT